MMEELKISCVLFSCNIFKITSSYHLLRELLIIMTKGSKKFTQSKIYSFLRFSNIYTDFKNEITKNNLMNIYDKLKKWLGLHNFLSCVKLMPSKFKDIEHI